MKRINNSPTEKLIFVPKSGLMISNDRVESHGLTIPNNKIIVQFGQFILGDLETDAGRKIEVMKRLPESYSIHLILPIARNIAATMPIRLFPNSEITTGVIVPNNYFLPYYNCHGCCFGEGEYYINPLACSMDNQGRMQLNKPNLEILLHDEYEIVEEKDNWDIGIFKNSANEILHSVKRQNGKVISKYDLFHEESHNDISQVDIARYGNGIFHYYKTKKYSLTQTR